MLAHPTARGLRTALVVVAASMLALATWAAFAASASSASPTASASAKKCGAGKTLVRRPGRSSVCAKKCPAGTKRKVSRRGKLSCARKPGTAPTPQAPGAQPPAGPSPAPSGPTGDAPPAPSNSEPANTAPTSPSGPAAGSYSGETEQSRPVGFTVEGGEVRVFEAGVNTWCNTMYNSRVNFDAIANIPPMSIGPDGSFSYEGDETNGNPKIVGQITGRTATGTVGMFRGDTNYSGGQMYFGNCQASDVKWTATAS